MGLPPPGEVTVQFYFFGSANVKQLRESLRVEHLQQINEVAASWQLEAGGNGRHPWANR